MLCERRFIDVPIESCGSSSPLRVALQASAPDLLLILLRYVANKAFDVGALTACTKQRACMSDNVVYCLARTHAAVCFRFGADPQPRDGGTSPVIAVLDKLAESERRSYVYQLVACLRIMLSCLVLVEMPYRVIDS